MRLKFPLLLCLCGLVSHAYAQQVDSLEFYEDVEPIRVRLMDLAFSMEFPSGAFADVASEEVYAGGSMLVLQQIYKEQPAFVGLEMTYSFRGSLGRTYEIVENFGVVEVDGSMSSNVIGANLVGRYYVPVQIGPIQTFMEMHIGGKWMYTYLSEVGVTLSGEDYSSTDFVESDIVPAYGGALGLQVALVEDLYLLIKGSYQIANSGSYRLRIPDDINVFPLFPEDGFERVSSATNNLRLDLGLTFSF